MKENLKVSAILAAQEKFEGKTVLVEGKILGVCQEMGCWIEVAGEKIKIKVKDDVIFFPKDSKGKTALVEGTVEEVKDEEACKDMDMKERAGEKKEADCCAEAAKKVYQIKGAVAVIK